MRIRLLYIFVGTFLLWGCGPSSRFAELSASKTGIDFANIIDESQENNIIVNEYIYNGSGIGVSDFDKDGLMDLFFSGNNVTNRLYLNQGDFVFTDVTNTAGVAGKDRWSSGVSIVDINRDGWPDVHVCATNRDETHFRDNQFYIHQGLDADSVPIFKDMAAEYGLADSSHSTHAAFFDYDNDGDMDIFIIIDEVEKVGAQNNFRPKRLDGSSPTTDRLYRNDWSDSLGHPVFTNISREAGILTEGYSLGINIVDINRDGWKDIFISNDYVTNDVLYLNQKDGTFKDVAKQLWKHTCHSAMGNDIIDLNHDGLADIVTLDMMPESNFRKKTMMASTNYTTYINNDRYDYDYQYVRNVFQLNQGTDPETDLPLFSDVGMLANIGQTDWSWTPSISDFDNDGLRDILITNGFPKDITDRDFINYHSQVFSLAKYEMLKERIPSVKLQNYAYHNQGDLQFADKSDDWGLTTASFSSGAVYADLDNDGDMDWVVNNINDPAFVYRNQTSADEGNHWFKVSLNGLADNPDAYGSWVEIWHDGKQQIWEHSLYRGYLCTVDPRVHFGLGKSQTIDSLVITRPDGKTQSWQDVSVDQFFIADLSEGTWRSPMEGGQAKKTLFTESSAALHLQYMARDSDFVDFNVQRLLPHKLSQYGPGLAVGDVNQDGLEDLYVSGSHFFKGRFFLQQENGQFQSQDLINGPTGSEKLEEELGALFFDADGDGDDDLYLVSGGNEFGLELSYYQDRLLVNDSGRFTAAPNALPDMLSSGSAVKAVDYDQDGDLDLFVGGRVVPEQYPRPATSYILRNESQAGQPRFVIDEQNQALFNELGLVCDAIWTDYDEDGWVDLIVAGEWMPLKIYHNEQGQLIDKTEASGISKQIGWWNSLTGVDLDLDGDTDYIAGNLGLNSFVRANDEQPIGIYAADFDQNGGYDPISSIYFKDLGGSKKEFPFFGRLDIEKQLVQVKKQFPFHQNFGRTTMQEFIALNPAEDIIQYHANYLQNSWVENLGDGKFKLHALPIEAQFAPIYGALAQDFNADGYPDIALVGNDYGTELMIGRYDAFNGLLLWNGPAGLKASGYVDTGFKVSGDAKALVGLNGSDGAYHLIASQNHDSLRVFSIPSGERLALAPGEAKEYNLANGKVLRWEGYCGSSYLSQSSSTYLLPASVPKQ
ncbi:MAG: VCBS repeat-containing protein [Bacteroidia bacterium]